jgi:crossover junction endodeoxyribonuclease RuvC
MKKEYNNTKKEQIILGIDPGTNALGYGVVKIVNNKIHLLDIGVLKLSGKEEVSTRLKRIFDRIIELIEMHLPDHLAIEAQFFGKNVQSMLKLGKAQGVSIAAALSREIPYTEYAPKKIKQSITGKGTASKEQVAGMLGSILQVKQLHDQLDATDALATAICHHFQSSGLQKEKKYSGWEGFIKNNPGKLK